MFVLDNVNPATDGVNLQVQVSVDAGANWKTSSYLCVAGLFAAGGTGQTTSTSAVLLNGTGISNATAGWSGSVTIHDPSNSSTVKHIHYNGIANRTSTAGIDIQMGGGYWNGGNDAMNAVRFLCSSGNIASGSIALYGLKNS
jgi:hypothetical protein